MRKMKYLVMSGGGKDREKEDREGGREREVEGLELHFNV